MKSFDDMNNSFKDFTLTFHVIFFAFFMLLGISIHMAPKVTADNIQNLLISVNDHGVSDHKTLLAAYQELDRHLTVVIIVDEHTSWFDLRVSLNFSKKGS